MTLLVAPWRVLTALLLVLAAAHVVAAPAAVASCADRPTASPYAFMGTVIDTARGGRVATVVTDSGERVTVLGSSDPSGVTSADRTYVVAGRYEFHPLDGTDPFEDNACTATRQVAGPTAAPQHDSTDVGRFIPDWLPVDENDPAPAAALLLLTAAVGGVVVARRARRG